jgi:hypothetical protein
MPRKMCNITLRLSKNEIAAIRRAMKRHKMSMDQFVEYAVKVHFRKGKDLTLPENAYYLFTTKEQRAWRRGIGRALDGEDFLSEKSNSL